jgi:hypothetical protein
MSIFSVFLIASVLAAQPPTPEKTPPILLLAKERRAIHESSLKKEGYPCETVAQLQEAVKNAERSHIRWMALYVLGARIGRDATPVFKEALKDPDFFVRKTAALFLGAFGDRSGVEVLGRDMAALAPRDGEPDPNMMKLEGKELERAKGKWNTDLEYAVEAAEALSQLGDTGGLRLAARVAVEGEYGAQRMHAISTLTNLVILAGSDESVLGGQTIDPESVLLTVAESETNPRVLRTLKSNAARLPRSKSVKIYEKLAASPHMEKKDRIMVRGYLKMHERDAKRRSMKQSDDSRKQ